MNIIFNPQELKFMKRFCPLLVGLQSTGPAQCSRSKPVASLHAPSIPRYLHRKFVFTWEIIICIQSRPVVSACVFGVVGGGGAVCKWPFDTEVLCVYVYGRVLCLSVSECVCLCLFGCLYASVYLCVVCECE
jgi:hypothetical protein